MAPNETNRSIREMQLTVIRRRLGLRTLRKNLAASKHVAMCAFSRRKIERSVHFFALEADLLWSGCHAHRYVRASNNSVSRRNSLSAASKISRHLLETSQAIWKGRIPTLLKLVLGLERVMGAANIPVSFYLQKTIVLITGRDRSQSNSVIANESIQARLLQRSP